MLHPLCALALWSCASLLPWPAAAAAAVKVGIWSEWGVSAGLAEPWPVPLPALPAAEGWAYCLRPALAAQVRVLCATDELLFVCTDEHLAAYELANGRRRWAGGYGSLGDLTGAPAYQDRGVLFVRGSREGAPCWHALDTLTGQVLWQTSDFDLLAATAAGVWAWRAAPDRATPLAGERQPLLLAPRNGDVLQTYFVDSFVAAAPPDAALGAAYAISNGYEAIVLAPDGTSSAVPLQHLGAAPQLALDATALLVAEHSTSWPPGTPWGSPDVQQEVTLSCFAQPDGALRWRTRLPDALGAEPANPAPELDPWGFSLMLTPDRVIYSSNGSLYVLDRSSGAALFKHVQPGAYGLRTRLATPELLAVSGLRLDGAPPVTRVLRLGSMDWHAAPPELPGLRFVCGGGRISYAAQASARELDSAAGKGMLVSLRLAPEPGLAFVPGSVQPLPPDSPVPSW